MRWCIPKEKQIHQLGTTSEHVHHFKSLQQPLTWSLHHCWHTDLLQIHERFYNWFPNLVSQQVCLLGQLSPFHLIPWNYIRVIESFKQSINWEKRSISQMGFFETVVRIKDKVFEENMKVFYLFLMIYTSIWL